MIAGTHSGVGKTVITVGLLRALRQRGVAISAAKSGPDYIDPMYHTAACGRPSVNLDAWSMSTQTLRGRAYAQDGTHTLIEGAMGLYDAARDGHGSAAQLAKVLGVPVVLVMDTKGMGQSVRALVAGYHISGCEIAGVILNRVASARHEAILREALEPAFQVIGCVPRQEALALPSRHLGLVQAFEKNLESVFDNAAEIIEATCDLEALVEMFTPLQDGCITRMPAPGTQIAIARDKAFSFCYPHHMQDWQAQGAQLSFFSPLANEVPAEDADFIFLPGGYPELYAQQLATAQTFLSGVRKHAARGTQIYGECGGYMTLGKTLTDQDGTTHPMLGLLNMRTTFATRRLHLGYYAIDATTKGHAFHYATLTHQNGTPLWTSDASLPSEVAGLHHQNISGSFLHII